MGCREKLLLVASTPKRTTRFMFKKILYQFNTIFIGSSTFAFINRSYFVIKKLVLFRKISHIRMQILNYLIMLFTFNELLASIKHNHWKKLKKQMRSREFDSFDSCLTSFSTLLVHNAITTFTTTDGISWSHFIFMMTF